MRIRRPRSSMWNFNRSRACVSCHFFTKVFRGDDGRPLTFGVNQEERTMSVNDNWAWHKQHYAIACNCGIWDLPGAERLKSPIRQILMASPPEAPDRATGKPRSSFCSVHSGLT